MKKKGYAQTKCAIRMTKTKDKLKKILIASVRKPIRHIKRPIGKSRKQSRPRKTLRGPEKRVQMKKSWHTWRNKPLGNVRRLKMPRSVRSKSNTRLI